MVVLITGGSGMAGQALAEKLNAAGHEVRILSRKIYESPYAVYVWNIEESYLDPTALKNVDTVIHLAGTPIAEGRWTMKRKAEILSSRVDASLLILKTIKENKLRIKTFISASAIGIYGNRPNQTLTEKSEKGYGFIADVCALWEGAAHKFSEIGCGVYVNRIGIVLGDNSGFVKKIYALMRWNLAAELGDGKQITSWIHLDDLVEILFQQTTGKLNPGTYNAVSPNPETHSGIMKVMAKKAGKYNWLPNIPLVMLRMLFGELAYELIANQDVNPDMLLNQGFEFKYAKVEEAVGMLNF